MFNERKLLALPGLRDPVTATVGTALVGGVMQNRAGRRQADASRDATAATIAEQQRQFDLTRQDTQYLRDAGQQATGKLRDLMFGGGDANEFMQNDPGYMFRLSQGEQGMERAMSSRGGRLGGRALKELTRYNSDYASNEYGKSMNRLFTLAGFGPQGIGMSSNAGTNAANQIGNAHMQNAALQGQAAQTQYGGINNAMQSGMQNYMMWQMYNSPGIGGIGAGGAGGAGGFA